MARSPNSHPISPDQGTLLLPGSQGDIPAVTYQQAFTPEPGPCVDMDARSEKILEAITLLGKMSSASGFNKAQFNPQTLQNLHDDRGIDGVAQTNSHIDRAKAKRPTKLRTLFSEASGYEPQDPKSDTYDPQSVDNIAFRKFKEKYQTSQHQKDRVAFRKTLIEQRESLKLKPVKTSRSKKR